MIIEGKSFASVNIRVYDCAMIGHTQFFLWSRYSDIISLLTITVRGGGGGGGGIKLALIIAFFSSPEPLGSQGELIVYPSSRRPSVRRPSVRPSS